MDEGQRPGDSRHHRQSLHPTTAVGTLHAESDGSQHDAVLARLGLAWRRQVVGAQFVKPALVRLFAGGPGHAAANRRERKGFDDIPAGDRARRDFFHRGFEIHSFPRSNSIISVKIFLGYPAFDHV